MTIVAMHPAYLKYYIKVKTQINMTSVFQRDQLDSGQWAVGIVAP